jgi:HAD-superfamily hydrolase, subfamily IIB
MSIKLVAVDMDHTFLNSNKTYNIPRFRALFEKMQEQKIEFVVASGAQMQRLHSCFSEDIIDKITFIAENGAWIMRGNKEIKADEMSQKVVVEETNKLAYLPLIDVSVSGKKSTYVLESLHDIYYQAMQKFYPMIEKVETFADITDEILKFSIKSRIMPTQIALQMISPIISAEFCPMPSGHISIDITLPHVHKGSALAYVANMYDIDLGDCLAFGDNENDRTMLASVGQGYVMKNAVPSLFDVSPLRAPSNDEDGVLAILERLL